MEEFRFKLPPLTTRLFSFFLAHTSLRSLSLSPSLSLTHLPLSLLSRSLPG